jgi:hypothetical protein
MPNPRPSINREGLEAISDRARFLAEELKLSSIDPVLRKKTGLK